MVGLTEPEPDLPPLQREQAGALYSTTRHLLAMFEEFDALPEAYEQPRDMGTLGEKPLAVASASDLGASQMGNVDPVEYERECATQNLQEELATLSSDSTHRVTEQATHGSVVTNE